MRGGFSFCGVDIADLNLVYAPDLQDTYVYRPTDVSIHDQTFDSHAGGYFYGVTKQPKDFTLRCVFEESAVDRGISTRLYTLFKRGANGRLVFARRPWVYYNVVIVDTTMDITNYMNGFFTIYARAYYPFGRCDMYTCPPENELFPQVIENSALFDKAEMEPPLLFTNMTANNTDAILLANGGTERAAVSIAIAGDVGSGVTIANKTNGMTCTFIGLTTANTTDANSYVYMDSLNGKTMLIDGLGQKHMAFVYHKEGRIELEPNYPCNRDVYVSYNNSTTVTIANTEGYQYTGQYIYLATTVNEEVKDTWIKINAQPTPTTLTLAKSVPGKASTRTTIMPMNEIFVTSQSGMNLSKLEFNFKPTFA